MKGDPDGRVRFLNETVSRFRVENMRERWHTRKQAKYIPPVHIKG